MRKFVEGAALLLLLCCVFCLGFFPQQALAANDITIQVNGAVVQGDQGAYIVDGVTMVPLRFVGEAVGGTIGWDEASQTASINRNGQVASVTIGQNIGLANGVEYPLLRSAELKNERTMVPLRFFAEALGATVGWDQATWTVTVNFDDMPLQGVNIIGYYYDRNSLTQLQSQGATFTDVLHFGYSLSADGTVAEKANFDADLFESEGKALAESYGANTLMLVTAFNRDISDSILSDPNLRSYAVQNIAAIVREKDFDGVDLDFEAVSASCRDFYPAFVRELKAELGAGYIVSISVTSRNSDSQTWKDGYDYAALAEAADRVLVMFYDQHYSGGEPGPIAGADWVEEGIQYLLQYIPASKLHVGLGAYGRNWPEGSTATTVYMDSAEPFAAEKGATIQRDPDAGTPWFEYVDENGVRHEVWYEDAQSLCQKAALVKKYNLAGIALWRMGFPPDDVWQAIVNTVK